MKSSDHSVSFQIQANFGDKKKKRKICLFAGSSVWSNAAFLCFVPFSREYQTNFTQFHTDQYSSDKLEQAETKTEKQLKHEEHVKSNKNRQQDYRKIDDYWWSEEQ